MKLRVTVEGKSYEVEVDVLEGEVPAMAHAPSAPPPPRAASAPAASLPPPGAAAGGSSANLFPAPLSGTVRAVRVKAGDSVDANQELIILEAMKMETSIYSPRAGTIKAVLVREGDVVPSGTPLVEFD